MIISNYQLIVCCDMDKYCLSEKQSPAMFEFYGDNKSICLLKARKARWHFRAGKYVICGDCWAAGHRP